MAYSRFDSVQLNGSGTVVVSGPINFAQDEQDVTVVASVNFVLVQDKVFVPGRGTAEGKGRWGGQSDKADKLSAGPAQGFGIAMLVREPQPATAATATTPAIPASPPLVQMLTWSEPVKITM
jgi:hypothetical protein